MADDKDRRFDFFAAVAPEEYIVEQQGNIVENAKGGSTYQKPQQGRAEAEGIPAS